MTKFNPDNKAVLTYGECLTPAMGITDKADAQQYLSEYIHYIQQAIDKESRSDNTNAEQIAKGNIGYYAGYYGNEVRQRVEKLFNCSHPIFGAIEENGAPTSDEAFQCGLKAKSLSEIRG